MTTSVAVTGGSISTAVTGGNIAASVAGGNISVAIETHPAYLPYSTDTMPTLSGDYGLLYGGSVDMVVKLRGTYNTGEYFGVVKMDATGQNGLRAYYSNHDGTYCKVKLDKIVGGVVTNLIDTWTNVNGSGYPQSGSARQPVSNSWLELRCSGTSVSVWQFDLQVGTTQTVSDAAILAANYFGVYSSEGLSTLTALYACERLTDYILGWAGSSNTYNNTTGYRYLTNDYIKVNYPQYDLNALNISANGWATFPNLVNLADLSTATLLIFDQSNDGSDDLPEFEGFIRKCIEAGQKVIAVLNPSWTATTDDQIDTPYNLTALQGQRAILSAYGVDYVDGHVLLQAHVTGGGHITDWFADTAHYNATGYAAIAAGLEALLFGTVPALVDYVNADAADYDGTPVIVNGTDNDGTTGTWAETGTSISSSSAGATITFIFTGRKFGIYDEGGSYPLCTAVIDGGTPITNFQPYPNGYDAGNSGSHTVIFTVATNLTIDEFWVV